MLKGKIYIAIKRMKQDKAPGLINVSIEIYYLQGRLGRGNKAGPEEDEQLQ